MIELKLCMIDDIRNDLAQLEEYLRDRIPEIVRNGSISSFSFPLSNEETGEEYDREDQVKRIYDTLRNNWNDFDVFLLDWSLLGNKDEGINAVSVEILHRLFKEYTQSCSDIKNEEKFVIIITGKRSRKVDFSFEEVDSKVVCADKPSGEERTFCKACCQCPSGIFKGGHCGLSDNGKKECMADDCLPELLKMIFKIKEGKKNEHA